MGRPPAGAPAPPPRSQPHPPPPPGFTRASWLWELHRTGQINAHVLIRELERTLSAPESPASVVRLVIRGDASERVVEWSDAGVTHRPCPQGPIFDRRPRPPVKPVPPSPGHDEGARPDRAPWLHGLRRRLYPERLWWRYITRRCLG